MSAQLTKKQVQDFETDLFTCYFENQDQIQRDLLNTDESAEIDSEFEGCVNLLFDLMYTDTDEVPALTRNSSK